MYKSIVSLLSVLSMSNAQTSTMEPTTYVCGNQQQDATNNIDVYLAFDYDLSMVYITLSGPSDQYFAVGFGQTQMDFAYAIVVDGDGTVRERRLGTTGAGDVLEQTVTELANYVEGGIRTVLLSRALDGADSDYFTFTTYDDSSSLDMIWATADTVEISAHTAYGNNMPITNFMDSDGTDDSCGALDSEGDFDTTMTPADMDTTMGYAYYCGNAVQDSTLNIAAYVAVSDTTAYITLTGPDGQYFAVGLGQTQMDFAYVIVVDGDGTVSERMLGSTDAGDELTATVTVISNEVVGSIRTVYLSRALEGMDDDYYTFTFDSSDLNLIWATADTVQISGHTSAGNASPITNFMGSDGTDATCGALSIAGTGGDDEMTTSMVPDDMDTTMDYAYWCGNQVQDATTNIAVYLAVTDSMVYITLTGPDGQYFGIGFGTTEMDFAYAIIVDGDGTVRERKLGTTDAGDVLTATVTELSNEVSDDVRTVYLSRALEGADDDYYTFTSYDSSSTLNLIWATADSVTIVAHTSVGNTSPITNFMGSDGSDDSCGALSMTGDDISTSMVPDDMDMTPAGDDSSGVSIGITVTFCLLSVVLTFLV